MLSNRFNCTPNPRDLTSDELDKFNLRYYEGTPLSPAFEGTLTIWSAADTGKDPVYRLYDRGVNYLVILRYDWDKDIWEKIELEDVHNVYGMLWLMSLELIKLKEK